MEEIKHIIAKFWAGTTTDAEKQRLAKQLTQDEQVWQTILEHEYEQSLNGTDKPLNDEQSGRVLTRLHRQILGADAVRPKVVFWRSRSVWVAAAMLALVFGWSIYQYRQTKWSVPALTQQQVRKPWQLTRKTNTSETVMNVTLADGSTLKLQPGSSASFYEPFGSPSRSISLTGEALFTVAKDPKHPFVVLANGFTTTALGTQFRIQATAPNQLSVRLLDGRVVVRSTPESGLTITDMYLKPGQEFTVNKRTKQVRIDRFDQTTSEPDRASAAKPVPVIVPGLTVAKEPLNVVLAQVGERYRVQIDYDPADVQGLSFSGSFESADSLSIVLGVVCRMNNLSFKQESGKVTISKSP